MKDKGLPGLASSEWFSLLVSFEFVFVLFLRAAEFRTLPGFRSISQWINLTGFFMAITGVQALYIFLVRAMSNQQKFEKEKSYYLYFVFLFIVYFLVTYSFTPNNAKTNKKALELVFINSWALIAPLFIINSRTRIKKLIVSFILIGVILSVVGIIRYMYGNIGLRELTGAIGKGGYHRLGRTAGASALVVFAIYTCKKSSIYGLTTLIVVALCLGGLIVSGQRAPWFATPIVFVIMLLGRLIFYKRLSSLSIKKYIITGSLSVLIGAVLLLYTERGNYVIQRADFVTETVVNKNRLLMWRESFNHIPNNIVFGVGLGRFSKVTGLEIWRQPHNMYIETILETGIVGFILLNIVIFYWFGLALLKNKRMNYLQIGYIAAFLFFFANAMSSGSITDNRVLFALSSAMVPLFIHNVSK